MINPNSNTIGSHHDYTTFTNPFHAEASTSKASGSRAHQPMSYHAMERELQDWVKNGPTNEQSNRQTAAKRILECHPSQKGHKTELDLGSLGLTSLPESLKQLSHLASINCKDNAFNLQEMRNKINIPEGIVTYIDGQVDEGKREYISQLNGFYLVDGKISFPEGETHEGQREYIHELNDIYHVNGKCTYSDGSIDEGKWEYIPSLQISSFIQGKRSLVDGTIIEGTWEYIPKLKLVALVKGKVNWPDGEYYEGTWGYDQEQRDMHIVRGKIIHCNGTTIEGDMKYIEELKRTVLVKGKKTMPDGSTQEGKWHFNRRKQELVFTPQKTTRPDDIGTTKVTDTNHGDKKMNLDMMERELITWVNLGPTSEQGNRQTAKSLILACHPDQHPPKTELNLDELGITTLPNCIGELTQLKMLLLSKNNLTALPDSFGNFAQLKTLSLANNPLRTLPDSFGNLTNLENLNLLITRLETLPASFYKLTKLRHMPLKTTFIQTLPFTLKAFWETRPLELGNEHTIVYVNNKTCKQVYGPHPYVRAAEGERQYIPDLDRMEVTKGKVFHPNGRVDEGEFEFIKALGDMKLVKGSKTFPYRGTQTGEWYYSVRKQGMVHRLGPMPLPAVGAPEAQLKNHLNVWTLSEPQENRAEASARILAAFGNPTLTELDLSGLGLSRLPAFAFTHLPQLTHLNIGQNPLKTLPAELVGLKALKYLNIDTENHALIFIHDALKEWWKTHRFESLNGAPQTTLFEVLGKVKTEAKMVAQVREELAVLQTLSEDLQQHPNYIAFFNEFVKAWTTEHAKQVAHFVGYSNITAPRPVQAGAAAIGSTSVPFVSVLGHALNSGSAQYLILKAKNKAEQMFNNATLSSNNHEIFATRLAVLLTQHFALPIQQLSATPVGRAQPGLLRRAGLRTQLTPVQTFAYDLNKKVKKIVSHPEGIAPEVLNQQHRVFEYPYLLAEHVFEKLTKPLHT